MGGLAKTNKNTPEIKKRASTPEARPTEGVQLCGDSTCFHFKNQTGPTSSRTGGCGTEKLRKKLATVESTGAVACRTEKWRKRLAAVEPTGAASCGTKVLAAVEHQRR